MNESSLTGESMPVQKYALSGESGIEFDSHGSCAKSTLFAGTTVLQAGASEDDQVLALVMGTGINTSKGDLVSSILFPETVLFRYDEEMIVSYYFLSI